MAANFHWSGDDFKEFQRELRELGVEMTRDAALLVLQTAHDAAKDIRDAYPFVTGKLRDGVTVEGGTVAGEMVASSRVVSTAWYAKIFEYGSQTRKTASGHPNPLPAGKVFVPRVVKHRRALNRKLRALMIEHGASKVRGAA